MQLFLQQLVNGLALGSVYALMAIGFTLIFGVLRLLNMAHGELYAAGAYLAYAGVTLLGLSPWLALPLAVAAVFALALVVERVAFRPLRDAPHFMPLVSTIAASTILMELIRLGFGPTLLGVEPLLPFASIDLGVVRANAVQLFLLGTSLALTAAVQLFLGRTQWGKAIRAVSQDPVVGRLLGVDVDRVIGATFGLGSALGAVAGVLIATYVGAIYPDMGFVALVKAFTAAILGGMGSVPGAVLGGFVLGVVESLGAGYLPSGFSDAVPYLTLFLVLMFLPGGLTGQGRRSAAEAVHALARGSAGLLERLLGTRRERVPPVAAGALLAAAVLVVAPFAGDYLLRVMTAIAIYALMALGTNVLLGLAGQLGLCHAAFFAIGAYASAIATTKWGAGSWTGLLLGVLVSGAAGFAVSLVTFRVRGYYLALVTLAFGELTRVLISYWVGVTGGMMGIRGVPPVRIGPWSLDGPLEMFYLCAAFLLAGVVVYRAIAYSVIGRALVAVRDDETAARASGLDAGRLKVFAFVASALFAAVGGSLYAHLLTAISPELASMHETVAVLMISVLGGLGSAAGALFGASVVHLLPELFREFGDYRLLVYGAILFVMILYQPQGLFSIWGRLARSS